MKNLDKESVTGISALLVHTAKIDEIYTEKEKDLVRKFIKSYLKEEEINETLKKAEETGVEVVSESIPGKGQVVRRMFADTEADIYILIDGDATYDPADSPLLVKTLLDGAYDMVTGSRLEIKENSVRKGHAFGNKMFNRLYRTLFGSEFTDIFTGYRVLTRRFVKSFPAVSSGFEVEAELSVHASQLRLPVMEVPVSYGVRPEGSTSKLRTFADGFGILKSMLLLLKENRPLFLFGLIAGLSFLTAAGISIPLINTYAETGLVPRLPTAVFSMGLVLISLLSLVSGLILDSIANARVEIKRLRYLQIPLRKKDG